MDIKCKDCVFYSGIECHGHGDYWASCNLITSIKKILASLNHVSTYDLKYKFVDDIWDTALGENSNCLLFSIKEN